MEYSDYFFEGSATRISPAGYVVHASYGVWFRTGAFMVVARSQQGRFEALWCIKDLAEQHYAQRDEIGRWLHLVRQAYYNGPLDVRKVLPLAESTDGYARFLVDAYQGAHGGTILGQLSIWEWDGSKAKPLLIDAYHYAADQYRFRFDRQTFRIAIKAQLSTLFSCGSCPEPRGVWSLRVTPTGVKDLGRRFLQPEIEWADELLTKVGAGGDASSLASASVLNTLKRRMSEDSESSGPSSNAGFSLGMLGLCRVIRRGRTGAFELTTDEARLRFTYELRGGRPYFTGLQIN